MRNKELTRGLNFAIDNQLSIQDMRLMLLFFEADNLSTNQIKDKMGLSRITCYNMIQRLIKKDMIEFVEIIHGMNYYRMMLRHVIRKR